MTTTQVSPNKNKTILFNRIGYGAFVLLSIYFLVTKDFGTAASNLCIALVFDPFDQTVTWNKRPLYQRVWLIVHLVVVACIGIVWINYSF